MDTSELKSIIDNILSDAFKRIEYAYQHHCENSPKTSHNELTRLVFPSYANEKTRISEQELRFAFVEAFNAYAMKIRSICSTPLRHQLENDITSLEATLKMYLKMKEEEALNLI